MVEGDRSRRGLLRLLLGLLGSRLRPRKLLLELELGNVRRWLLGALGSAGQEVLQREGVRCGLTLDHTIVLARAALKDKRAHRH